ncbi:MAG: hypothetical protein ACI971_002205 [Colwellia sp.]|jgi:hypothetical protein
MTFTFLYQQHTIEFKCGYVGHETSLLKVMN